MRRTWGLVVRKRKVVLALLGIAWIVIAFTRLVELIPNYCQRLLTQACGRLIWGWIGDFTTFQWGSQGASLLGTIVTLAGVIVAGTMVRQQISQIERHRLQERAQRLLGARSNLSLKLSALSRETRRIGCTLTSLYSHLQRRPGQIISASHIEYEPISADVIFALREMVELAHTEGESRVYAEILSRIQVLQSRLEGLTTRVGNGRRGRPSNLHEVAGYIVNVIDLLKACDDLYGYARFETDEVRTHRITSGEVHGDLGIGLYREFHGMVFDILDRRESQPSI